MNTPVRTRTRRAPLAVTPTVAVQPVSKPSLTIDLLDQPACHHRTDFEELERRLYMSSNPEHWAQAAALDGIRESTEYRIEAENEEAYGNLDDRNRERLALRDLVRKLVARLKEPLEIKVELKLTESGNESMVTLADQDALDELLEEADEVINEYDVDVLEDSEKPKKEEKKG